MTMDKSGDELKQALTLDAVVDIKCPACSGCPRRENCARRALMLTMIRSMEVSIDELKRLFI